MTLIDTTDMTAPTTEPLRAVTLTPTTRPAASLVRDTISGDLDLNPPYQRGQVWTRQQQVALIRSTLLGIPLPSITVNNREAFQGGVAVDEPLWVCIDGKQRLTALRAWWTGDLAVPASWFAPEDVENVGEGDLVTYAALTPTARRRWDNRTLVQVSVAQVSSVAQEASIYLLLNGTGTAQSEEDMANARAVAQA